MENEKNFFTALILTVLIIIFYPMVMKHFFPPPAEILQQQTTQEQTEERPALISKTTALNQSTNPNLVTPEIKTDIQQEAYIIENNRFRVVISSPAADIQKIELKTLPNPETQQPTIIMDSQNKYAGIFATNSLLSGARLKSVVTAQTRIKFVYEKNDLEVIKTITLDEETYSIQALIELKNIQEKNLLLQYDLIAATGLKKVSRIENRFREAIAVLQNGKIYKKNISSIKKENQISGDIKLAGFKARYFSLIVAPVVVCRNANEYKDLGDKSSLSASINIEIEPLEIPAGSTQIHKFVLYAGPNDFEEMSRLNLGVEKVRGSGFFAGFSDLLLLLLRFLYGLFRNYGLAVIALSLCINLVLYPLTYKSLRSMKEMQALQPLVEKLRKENKDNPQKLNKETMELYKKHKVNPAGGCLPMLLQMPVFFSLYGVLMRAIELRGASFLWIKDLAAPDAFYKLPTTLPIIGDNINLLPLCMAVFTFVQQKLTNPQQANDQQKAMAVMMPIFLGCIFYNFPSGLVLYFLTNTIFSFVIQTKLSKQFSAQA